MTSLGEYERDVRPVTARAEDELKAGTLHAMCKQLGIGKDEL